MTSVRPKVVLLAAFENDGEGVDETSLWLSRLDFSEEVAVSGVDDPVYFDADRDVALVVTGVGNVEAAGTVNALVASPLVDCANAYFLTVGSAGTSPEVGTVGSVYVNDCILDWNQKYRWSPHDDPDSDVPFRELSFKSTDEVSKELNPALVEAAYDIGSEVQLVDSIDMWRYRSRYPYSAARSKPSVEVGASVSGSEFWHGPTCSAQAQRLAERHGAGTYSTTEMEGFGTALALERHGLLDRYLSVRGVSNFDRPHPGQDVSESLHENDLGLDVCMENVYRVGSSVLSRILDDWEQWRDGVPTRFEAPTT